MEIRIGNDYLEITRNTIEICISWQPNSSRALLLARTGDRQVLQWTVATGPMIEVDEIPEWLAAMLPTFDGDQWKHADVNAREFVRVFTGGFAIGDVVKTARYSTAPDLHEQTLTIQDIVTSGAAGAFAAIVTREGSLSNNRRIHLEDLEHVK